MKINYKFICIVTCILLFIIPSIYARTLKIDKNTYRTIFDEEIDITIKELEFENFKYGAEKNSFKVYFDPNITKDKDFVKIKKGDNEISFELEDAKKIKKIKKNKNTFTYMDVYDNTSITYEITHRKLKEYINLTQYTGTNTWTFKLKVKGLTYELEDNRVYFYEGGELVGMFDTPIAWDSNEDVIPINFSLSGNKLSMIVNDAWLQNAKYPVTIDPTYDDFEYDTGFQGGLSENLWNWSDTMEGEGANYNCLPACSQVDGWDIGVYAGRLNMFASYCHQATQCNHRVRVWTINNSEVFNATNIKNISYEYVVNGFIATPSDVSAEINFLTALDGIDYIYSYSKYGNTDGAGSYSESGIIDFVRNTTDLTKWKVYKDNVFVLDHTGTPTIAGAFRISAHALTSGTGAGYKSWINAYIYYVDFGLIIEDNIAPVLTRIATLKSIYNASDTIMVNVTEVSDQEDDTLNLTCCKGYDCNPTTTSNILTGGSYLNITSPYDMNGSFTAGFSAGTKYISCKVIDNGSLYSNKAITSYNLISNLSTTCEIPNAIWCEDFSYFVPFCDFGWENIPDWWGCSSGAYMPITNTPTEFNKLFQGSTWQLWANSTGGHPNPYDFIFYHYFPETNNPIISAAWEMEIGHLPVNLGLTHVALTKDLTNILILEWLNGYISFRESDGTWTDLCSSCWETGVTYNYKATMYLSTSAIYYDNATQEFKYHGANTFDLFQDGILIAKNKPLTTNVSEFDSYFLNRIRFFKDMSENLTLDNIVIYKGTQETYDDTDDITESPNATLPPEFIPPDDSFWGYKSKEDYCKNNIECCSLINTTTGIRYMITDQLCFARSGYSKQVGKFRKWMVGNQYLLIILVIILLIIIMTTINKRRND